jgi:hypothetical protein
VPIYDGRQRNLKYQKLDIEERTKVDKQKFFYQPVQSTGITAETCNCARLDQLFDKIRQQGGIYQRRLIAGVWEVTGDKR